MSKVQFSSADEAEAAFYDALARADLEAMMAIWADDEEVVCVHPGGVRQVGLAAVRDGWRELFASGTRLHIQLSQQVAVNTLVQSVRNMLEHVVAEGESRFAPPMAATNVFVRGPSGWRMVLHHASPLPDSEPAGLPDAPRTIH